MSKGPAEVKAFYNRMMVGDGAVVDSVSAAPVVEGRALNGDTSISYGRMNDTFKLKDGMEFHLDSRFSAWLVRDVTGTWLVPVFTCRPTSSTMRYRKPTFAKPPCGRESARALEV